MTTTVRDLLNQRTDSGLAGQADAKMEVKGSRVLGFVAPRLFKVTVIIEPEDIEIIDGKAVIRKEMIACSRGEVLGRLPIQVE